MASVQQKVDAVKTAAASVATCTPETVVTLKELLNLDTSPKPNSTTSKTSKAGAKTPAKTDGHGPLNARDRQSLATHVINVTLKSLTEAAKPTATSKSDGKALPAKRGALRRSLSTPLSPAPSRTLNRVATSPSIKSKVTANASRTASTACVATVECARLSFAALRSSKGPIQPGQTDFQLENGMATLAGKLIGLGFHEHASKELKILKSRLEGPPATTTPRTESNLVDLLEFRTPIAPSSRAIVVACQIQALRLIAATKKPTQVERVLPFVIESSPSSPTTILTDLAKDEPAESAKVARQLASLTQILLSVAPSIHSKDDSVAIEPRLSPSPTIAFQLQALAFRTQLRWWILAGHQGKIDEEILAPFSRCVKAFSRRANPDGEELYKKTAVAYEQLMSEVHASKYQPSQNSDSPIASIYHFLGTTAQTTKRYQDAQRWYRKLQPLLQHEGVAPSRCLSLSARLMSVILKGSKLGSDVESVSETVAKGLEGIFRGTAAELDELFESLALARRSASNYLANYLGENTKKTENPRLMDRLKDFVLRYPRFLRRWLGYPPEKDAHAKQILQYDQRKEILTQSVNYVLDSAFMVTKCEIESNDIDWATMDSVLLDCSKIIESLLDPTSTPTQAERLGVYRLKISTLYFLRFTLLKNISSRSKEETKQALQSLSRSIDAIKECAPAQQQRARLSMKLELFADMCKANGRSEDAIQALRSVCANMSESGVLAGVAESLASKAAGPAWNANDDSSALSRILRSIAKLDKSWSDWVFFLAEPERAAVLEHLMELSAATDKPVEPIGLGSSCAIALLRVYAQEKFPIRRLRVLLHLYYQNIGEKYEIEQISGQIAQVLPIAQDAEKTMDSGLVNFLPHLLASHCCLKAISQSDEHFAKTMMEAISSWTTMIQPCQSRNDIYTVLDNPTATQEMLMSASQLADFRGESRLQTSIMELYAAISKIFAQSSSEGLIAGQSLLAAQYVSVGLFPQALLALDQVKVLVSGGDEALSPASLAVYYLSQAEYHAESGQMDELTSSLVQAAAICTGSYSVWAATRTQASILHSMILFFHSIVSLHNGDIRKALDHARSSVSTLAHDWSKLEKSVFDSSFRESTPDTTKKEESQPAGPRIWALANPLIRSLLHVSSVYAHIGMFQETLYYAESALKIADSTRSTLYRAQVSAWLGSIHSKAGVLDKASSSFTQIQEWLPPDASSSRIRLARQLGDFYQGQGDEEKAQSFFKMAEDAAHELHHGVRALEAPKKILKPAPTRTTRGGGRALPTRSKAVATTTRRGAAAKVAPKPVKPEQTPPSDIHQASLLAAVLISRTLGFIQQKDWQSASETLKTVKELPKVAGLLSQEQLATATSLIGQSMEQMLGDPVYSMMPESTISYPAFSGSSTSKEQAPGGSPPLKGRKANEAKSKGRALFADTLRQAQDLLTEEYSSALARSESSTVHRISALLQDTMLLLSACSDSKVEISSSPSFAVVAVDLARNLSWRRELKTVDVSTSVPSPEIAPTTPELRASPDLARFQRDYIETIPRSWSVISLSLSENQHDLCITKLQAGHIPFVLRLPLERANSRDAGSELLSFDQGRRELLEIIEKANETCHSSRDFSVKGERSAWWAEREDLDNRLGELLGVIESTWLGGFKGVFSQHQRQSDLLARFQKTFNEILVRNLPSRAKPRGRKTAKAQPVALDPRILDLFIGLGNPEDPDCEFDDALTDLLYFVVDILQFNGETNAYDEIDFDSMMIETYDALRGYFQAAAAKEKEGRGAHTVLVLDKALHAFPWESMPCMEKIAVSRVPSLACLQRLIQDANGLSEGSSSGHRVSASSGTYMLNPSSDLKSTQSFFEPAFASLPSWNGITDRAPEETEFEQSLADTSIFVYFGHGSGAQYVRSKAIRKLSKCRPVTFLMGCSSAALTDAGEFMCYGTVWNYMMAGCPAVVGTLWDVTDRDIDRFAGRAFEEWGLFERGTFKETQKGRAPISRKVEEEDEEVEDDGGEKKSLVEAVVRARKACWFRYLNAAAVVVYGIPAYLDREG